MQILTSTKLFMQAVKFSLALGTSPPFARFDNFVTVGKTRLCWRFSQTYITTKLWHHLDKNRRCKHWSDVDEWLYPDRYGSRFYDRPIEFCIKQGLKPYSDAYWDCAIRCRYNCHFVFINIFSVNIAWLTPALLKVVYLSALPWCLHMSYGPEKWQSGITGLVL